MIKRQSKSKWKSLSPFIRNIILTSFEIVLIILFMMFIILVNPGCTVAPDDKTLDIDMRMQSDANGFYHITLNRTRTQTFYRISGTAYHNGIPSENIRVHWYSTHYWFLGDTVGYVIQRWVYDDKNREYREAVYLGIDTVYISYFKGMEVPTVNGVSYSNMRGEINTVFAPTWWMSGDTVSVIGLTENDSKIVRIVLH